MRLTKVHHDVKDLQKKKGDVFIGYQVLDKFNKKLEWIDPRIENTKQIDRIKDRGQNSRISEIGDIYPSAFHLYLHQDPERKRRLIYYKNPISYGYHNEESVVVAKRIFYSS